MLDPKIPIFCNYKSFRKLIFKYIIGTLPYTTLNFESLSMPWMTDDLISMLVEKRMRSSFTKRMKIDL